MFISPPATQLFDASGIHRVYKSGPATQVYLAQHLVAQGKTVVILLSSAAEINLYRALVQQTARVLNFGKSNGWSFRDILPAKIPGTIGENVGRPYFP